VQAILLVGGKGTRLRPLTINTPKPMLPVAGVPFTAHQIARARAAGVERVVLGTSYKAEIFEDYFGDGSQAGVQLRYMVEAQPLGTGGAIRYAAQELTCGPDDPVLVFNGDVLSGLDIAALVRRHQEADADVTLYLTRVADPRPFGLVPTDDEGRVTAFLEKPTTPQEIVTDQINAGCYVFRRSVIDTIPAGRPVSVERETFPGLLESGATVLGVVDEAYWLDLGTPLAFVQGSCELVTGLIDSPALPGATGESLVLEGASVSPQAQLTGGTTIGEFSIVGPGAQVAGSVVLPRAQIGAGAVVRGSVVGSGAVIGEGAVLDGAVIGDGAHIGAGNELLSGVRVFPGHSIPAGSIRFSADQ
jgi:mannose-1-phosphate guanylyltransferase